MSKNEEVYIVVCVSKWLSFSEVGWRKEWRSARETLEGEAFAGGPRTNGDNLQRLAHHFRATVSDTRGRVSRRFFVAVPRGAVMTCNNGDSTNSSPYFIIGFVPNRKSSIISVAHARYVHCKLGEYCCLDGSTV